MAEAIAFSHDELRQRAMSDTLTGLLKGVHDFLADGRPINAAVLTVLIAWPYLTHAWTRCWTPSAPSIPSDSPRLYRAAALIPAFMLALSFVPPPAG